MLRSIVFLLNNGVNAAAYSPQFSGCSLKTRPTCLSRAPLRPSQPPTAWQPTNHLPGLPGIKTALPAPNQNKPSRSKHPKPFAAPQARAITPPRTQKCQPQNEKRLAFLPYQHFNKQKRRIVCSAAFFMRITLQQTPPRSRRPPDRNRTTCRSPCRRPGT